MIHVLPVNDSSAHTESSTCSCEPKLITENGEMILIHNSFDGREGVELVNEVLTVAVSDTTKLHSSTNADNLEQ